MRKVFYNVEGTIFTSYTQAMRFKEATEDLENRSVDMETLLEEIAEEDTEVKQEHRAKVNEVLHAGFSIPM